MIKKSGVFILGSGKDVEVKFPVSSGRHDVPASYTQAEDKVRMLKWERANIEADIQREQQLLDHAMANFPRKA
ncbi:Protein DEFECTIVE IN MERISTEM SILENCING 3 [Quillaja saponaria]|uniref:Protein DEFECTIVE IN MERISTEM SILENCING 3 n=1 Tax=Quillaja saponaria TaxID=32244 RepID=A0AAD7PDW2_QUISA|nr:Protein DEFECTIVE IN MERISTEM SILENCING 3 [Quillaja saponaria]